MSVKKVLASGHELETIEPMPPAMRKQLLAMREMVQKKAQQLGVEAAVLAEKLATERGYSISRGVWAEAAD